MKKLFALKLLLCSLPLTALYTTYTSAQAADRIENVTVIGTRQAYQGDFSVLETPQADLLISSEVIDNQGVLGLVQALDLSASVARQNNFGGLWNSFAVRGFVGDENLPSNYLVNGFNAGRGFGGARDLSGIESVEVLRGPRAALFGRGEPGGTVNLTTKRPTFERQGSLRVSAGSFSTYRTDMDYTSPITENVAIRVVGFYEDAESFRDTIETRRQGLSPSIAWKTSEQSALVYEIEYSHQEVPFDRGIVAINGEFGALPESRFLGEPGDGPMEADVLGHQLEFQHDFNSDWSALIGFNSRDTSLEGFATENGFGGVDENSDLERFRRFRDYDASYSVLRAELSGRFSTGSAVHRVIVGVDADEFENDQVFLRIRNREFDQTINVFDPVYGAYPLPTPNANTDRIETQKSQGLYIQDQISLADKLDLRIGARFDDYEQTLINRRNDDVFESSETEVSPQLGVVYKATESLSWYAVYGENFRPLSGATSSNNLDPNSSESIEVGIKFAINDGALKGTFAIFNVEQSNISTVDADFNATAIGEASSQGFEIDINGNISETLGLWFSYAYVDAKTENAFNDPNFGTVVPAGSNLLNIPESQLSVQLVKEIQLNGNKLDIIGGVIYVDERNGFFSDQSFNLPGYTTTRIATIFELTNSVELTAEVNNLFDEEYYTNSFADVWVQPGTPRNVRFAATLRF